LSVILKLQISLLPATRMAQAGVDLVTLAGMLGHSRISLVMRYAHPSDEHQFAAMEKRLRYLAK
jgi:site-specific recombinase XerD